MGLERSLFASGLILATLIGCGPPHIAPFTPRHRLYKPGDYAQRDPSAKPTSGSLFSDANGGYLEDTRAVRVGDAVVIRIDESADASGSATTGLNRTNTASMGASNVLGLMGALKAAHPGIDREEARHAYAASLQFAGERDDGAATTR